MTGECKTYFENFLTQSGIGMDRQIWLTIQGHHVTTRGSHIHYSLTFQRTNLVVTVERLCHIRGQLIGVLSIHQSVSQSGPHTQLQLSYKSFKVLIHMHILTK